MVTRLLVTYSKGLCLLCGCCCYVLCLINSVADLHIFLFGCCLLVVDLVWTVVCDMLVDYFCGFVRGFWLLYDLFGVCFVV